MKELAEGSRDIIASTTGWDINPRVLGIVPEEAKVATLKGFHWVGDAHYMVVPKGVSDEKLGVLLDLMSFLLQKEQQAYTYDQGYFYPGPAVKGVTLDMAPEDSQEAIKEFGRPEYEKLDRRGPGRAAARAAGDGRGLPALGRDRWAPRSRSSDVPHGRPRPRGPSPRPTSASCASIAIGRDFGKLQRAARRLAHRRRAASSSRCSAPPAAASRRRSTASPACWR